MTFIGHYRLINPHLMLMDWEYFYNRFQIWRPITAGLFRGGLSFGFLFDIVFFYRFCKRLEEDAYQGKRAQFVWTVAIMWVVLTVAAIFLKFYIFGECISMAIIYLWSQLFKDEIVSFFFGVRVKAMYFPWAMLAFGVLTGRPSFEKLVGIVVGHVIFFLEYVYPEASGVTIIPRPPQFLHNWFAEPRGANIAGFGNAPARRVVDDQARSHDNSTRHRWGRGNSLGGDNR